MHPSPPQGHSPDRDIPGMDLAPDKETAPSIHATMARQEELTRIEEAIRDPEAQESIQRPHNMNRALVAYERRLPPEMLSDVFRHYLDPDITSYHETQLLLMRVCRRWRRIAAGTPSLWTNLFLESQSQLNPCQIIRTGLANSGVLPMTASIFPHVWLNRWNKQEAIRLLVDNFHRFSHFSAEGDDDLYRRFFGHETLIHAPLLESFLFSGYVVVHPPPPSGERIRAPRLKSITLPHKSAMDLMSLNPMSLCDVTLNTCEEHEILPLLYFLASCPGIYSLDLIIQEAIQPLHVEERSRILFPCLDTLSITFYDGYDPCTFLRTVKVPALQTLSINREAYEEAPNLPLFLTTLDSLFENNAPLEYLDIGRMDLGDGPLFASMLGRLQDLCSLTLMSCTIDDAILKSLTLDAGLLGSVGICPSLSYLFVSYSEYSHDLFLRLVRSRTCLNPDLASFGGQHLRHLHASYIECTDTDMEAQRTFIASLDDICQSCGGHLEVVCSKLPD